MDFLLADFNDSDAYFSGDGAAEWQDIEAIVRDLPLCLQPSGQAGIAGNAVFDPKATNAFLGRASLARGWRVIPVPAGLSEFGTDWDGGKAATLAEWQFSNYPFLWNNVIRSEAMFKSQTPIEHLQPIKGLIVVTKSGIFPSSASSLYFEQGRAQLTGVMRFNTFSIPIRLVGLTIPAETVAIDVTWSEYEGRTSRTVAQQETKTMTVQWSRFKGKYGSPSARFRER